MPRLRSVSLLLMILWLSLSGEVVEWLKLGARLVVVLLVVVPVVLLISVVELSSAYAPWRREPTEIKPIP